MREMRYVLVIMMLLLVACSFRPGPVDTTQEEFYEGTRGVEARFEHVPNRLFFYRDPGNADNRFEVSVEVRNEGASWSRGAVFMSGYDPNILQFEEVPIGGGQFGACGLSIGSIGLGEWGGIFSCEGFDVGGTSGGNFFLDVNGIQDFAQAMGWDPGKFDLNLDAQNNDGDWTFNLGFIGANLDMEYLGKGRLLVAFFEGIDFSRSNGREYVLPGRSYEYPVGGVDYMTYTGVLDANGWPPGLDTLPQNILMTNCYFYSTYAAPLVCIDPDPYSGEPKVCSPRQMTFSGSQGAPVAITSIEQEATPRQMNFRINIENRGGGQVYDPGMLEKCSPYLADRVRPEDKNIVWVSDIRIGNTRLVNCVPNGIVRLQNGRGTITCAFPITGEYTVSKSAYETPLYVELWYGYSEVERRKINIKRVT